MRQNGRIEDEFQRRPQKPNRKKRKEASYQFVHSPVGRVAKILIGLIGDRNVSPNALVMKRNFAEQGVSEKKLFAEFMSAMPEFAEHYRETVGKPLTPNIVWNRYHKMYYTNGPKGRGGKPEKSAEHYTHSDRLRPYVPAVEAAFNKGPISLDQAIELGSTK